MDWVIDWLWQASVLACVVEYGLRLTGCLNAATRYLIWWITLGLVVMLPALPDAGLTILSANPVPSPGGVSDGGLIFTLPEAPAWIIRTMQAAWIAWVCISLLRLSIAFMRFYRTKATAAAFPPERERHLRMWNAVRTVGRPASLALSPGVRTGAMLGLGSPLIALPPALLDRLTDEELDAIVVHEYAHVQRRDDVTCLVQAMICAFVGWHPAVWWANRALTLEREVASDDWVINLTGSAKTYASCLLRLAASGGGTLSTVVAPGALLARAQLSVRIARLLDRRRQSGTVRLFPGVVVTVPLLLALTGGLLTAGPVVTFARPPLPAVGIGEVLIPVGRGVPVAQDFRPAILRQVTRNEGRETRNEVRGTRDEERRPPVDRALPGAQRLNLTNPTPVTPVAQDFSSAVTEPPPLPSSIFSAALPMAPATSADSQRNSEVRALARPQVAAPDDGPSPPVWKTAADAGVAVGAESRKAAVATAEFFSRFGKSVAHSF